MRTLSLLLSCLWLCAQAQAQETCQIKSPDLQASYEGDCVYGLAFGHGIAKGADGSWYEGQFIGGLRGGQGTMHYATGDIYQGQWKLDRRNGYGRYEYGEGSPWRGDVYEGYWHADQMHGTGTYIFYPSGDRFEARWNNGGTDTVGTTTLTRRKWGYESVAGPLSEVGATVCSVTTDGSSPRRIAKGEVQAAAGDRILVRVDSPDVLAASSLVNNPRWDVITEWTLCQP